MDVVFMVGIATGQESFRRCLSYLVHNGTPAMNSTVLLSTDNTVRVVHDPQLVDYVIICVVQVPYCTSVAWSADGATLYTGDPSTSLLIAQATYGYCNRVSSAAAVISLCMMGSFGPDRAWFWERG